MEFINKKKFIKTALNNNIKVFLINIAIFMSKITINLAQNTKITLL